MDEGKRYLQRTGTCEEANDGLVWRQARYQHRREVQQMQRYGEVLARYLESLHRQLGPAKPPMGSLQRAAAVELPLNPLKRTLQGGSPLPIAGASIRQVALWIPGCGLGQLDALSRSDMSIRRG